MRPSLEIEVGGVKFRNPIMLASGTAGFVNEIADLVNLSKLGAVITKTITPSPREGNPPPRIWETPAGMLNSIGLQNPGVARFIEEIVPTIEKLPTEIGVSVGGESVEDFVEIARSLEKFDFIRVLELNLSCPNVKRGGITFGKNPEMVRTVVEKVREVSSKSVWAKLSPQVSDIAEISRAAQLGGADAVCVINTFPAMAIDIWTREPHLGNITGGLSGPAIHPVAVATVFNLAREVDIPIIGIGGIHRPEDAVELLIAGATAVQIGSGYFTDTTLPEKTVNFLVEYLTVQRAEQLQEVIGSVKI